MANKGAVTGSITTSGGSYTIPAGYHNGSGKVTGPTLANLIGSNVTLANAAYLLTGYTAYGKSGTKYTGSMKNNGAVTKTFTPSTSAQSYTIPAGYHNGSGKVTCNAVVTNDLYIGEFTSSNGAEVSVTVKNYYSGYASLSANNFKVCPKNITYATGDSHGQFFTGTSAPTITSYTASTGILKFKGIHLFCSGTGQAYCDKYLVFIVL